MTLDEFMCEVPMYPADVRKLTTPQDVVVEGHVLLVDNETEGGFRKYCIGFDLDGVYCFSKSFEVETHMLSLHHLQQLVGKTEVIRIEGEYSPEKNRISVKRMAIPLFTSVGIYKVHSHNFAFVDHDAADLYQENPFPKKLPEY